ncbi:hypothetical protein V493_01936 [Pseudogymnoascus sp. VKM F-4281 (FW-2241)]|nr:hypothetical protein V493_01936 [Pseudogymnoascus sp. VKM F-4281 (FW-2241)]
MTTADFHGLDWTEESFSITPTWTVEPDLKAAEEMVKSLGVTSGPINLSFLAQGAFNKVYVLATPEDEEDLILRLTLPVDPRFKTLSEVATVEWLRHNTDIPVARIVRYGESRANLVGFEWILMTKLPGKHLGDAWMSIPYAAKEALVRKFAEFSSTLFRKPLSGIGNIYGSSRSSSSRVGRIVSMQFFWGEHIHYDIPRGPFSSSRDWINARLALNEQDCRSILGKHSGKGEDDIDSDDEADIDDAERTLDIITKLKPLVSQIFAVDHGGDEPSLLFHDDLSNHNILVDDSGALTGVLDWECVSAVPRWKACNYPTFLVSRSRDVKPEPKNYGYVDGKITELYGEHVMEYELTHLRRVFLDEMARLEPGWMEMYNSSQLQRDMELAVKFCDDEFSARRINEWVDDVVAAKSNIPSLWDRFYM